MDKRPWLFENATVRQVTDAEGELVYDERRQIALTEEDGRMIPAVESRYPPGSKKSDIEKGEDQKDRWA